MSEKDVNIETTFEIKNGYIVKTHFINYYRNRFFFLNIILGFLIVLLIGALWITISEILVNGYSFVAIVPIIIVALLFSLYFLSPIFSLLRLSNSWIRIGSQSEEHSWMINNERIEVKTKHKHIKIKWSEFYRIISTRNFFIFKTGPYNYYFLPKENLNQEEIIEIQFLLKHSLD